MNSARTVAVMLDGTKHEAVGVFMPLSDRVAFERRYNLSILEMARVTKDNLDDKGIPIGPVPDLTEERTAFFTWRLLARGECPVGSFDEFLDGVERIEIERLEGEADPTDGGPLPGILPSSPQTSDSPPTPS